MRAVTPSTIIALGLGPRSADGQSSKCAAAFAIGRGDGTVGCEVRATAGASRLAVTGPRGFERTLPGSIAGTRRYRKTRAAGTLRS